MIGVDRIPVTILTGFLGSGKTTLLAALIQRLSFSGTAVVMNEFGEIALDHQLIEMGDEDLLILSIGCSAAPPMATCLEQYWGCWLAGMLATLLSSGSSLKPQAWLILAQ